MTGILPICLFVIVNKNHFLEKVFSGDLNKTLQFFPVQKIKSLFERKQKWTLDSAEHIRGGKIQQQQGPFCADFAFFVVELKKQ